MPLMMSGVISTPTILRDLLIWYDASHRLYGDL